MKKIILITLLLLIPTNIKAITVEDFQKAMAGVSTNAVTTYKNEFIYSYFFGGTKENPINLKSSTVDKWLSNGYAGKTSTGYKYGFKHNPGVQGSFKNKFAVYCETFVYLMIRHAAGTGISYWNDFENIPASELRPGDIIVFEEDSHVGIYISGSDGAYMVAHARSVGAEYVLYNSKASYGRRLKTSALSKLNYNLVTASYDLHDRLDDEKPVFVSAYQTDKKESITINATDYKSYSLESKSDLVEPENYGIVYYQVTNNNTEPFTNWKSIAKTSNLTMTTPEVKAGTWYVWIKDVGGNVAYKEVVVKPIDKTKPQIGTMKSTVTTNSITVNTEGATDENGIQLYRFYLNNKLLQSAQSSKCTFTNLESSTVYSIRYEVIDNYNNVSSSTEYKIKTNDKVDSITFAKTNIFLKPNDSYLITPIIKSTEKNYKIQFESSDQAVATIDEYGNVKAIKPGKAMITVKVENKIENCFITVIEYKISLEKQNVTLKYGESYEINAIVEGIESYTPIYKSSNTAVASVDSSGIVTANSKGETTITVTIDSVSTTLNVTVNEYGLNIITEDLQEGTQNVEYYDQILANFAAAKIDLYVGKMPSGLIFKDGLIMGIPTEAGEYKITVNAQYKDEQFAKSFTLKIKPVESQKPSETNPEPIITEESKEPGINYTYIVLIVGVGALIFILVKKLLKKK